MCGGDLRDDLIKRERRGVDDPRPGRAMRQYAFGDKRAGIETDRTGGDEVAAAQCQQIRGARPRADEMHRHAPPPSAIAAVAVRSCETTRVAINRAPGPAAASAAASATDPVPNLSATSFDRVGVSMPTSISA